MSLGPTHLLSLYTVESLAQIYLADNQWEKAETVLVSILREMPQSPLSLSTEDFHQIERLGLRYLNRSFTGGGGLKTSDLPPWTLSYFIHDRGGSTNTGIVLVMRDLVSIYLQQCRWRDAWSLLIILVPLSIHMRHKTQLDAGDIIVSVNNLALVYYELEQLERALFLFSLVVNANRCHCGDCHPQTLISMENLGWVYFALGLSEDASKILGPLASSLPSGCVDTWFHPVSAQSKLSQICLEQQDYQTGHRLISEIIDYYTSSCARNHPEAIKWISQKGAALIADGQWLKAWNTLSQAVTAMGNNFDPQRIETLNLTVNLIYAGAMIEQDVPKSNNILCQALRLNKDRNDWNAVENTITVMKNLATIYLGRERSEDAIGLLTAIREEQATFPKATCGEVVKTTRHIAQIHRANGHFLRARAILHKTLAASEKGLFGPHLEVALLGVELAAAYFEDGLWRVAQRLLFDILDRTRQSFGDCDPMSLRCMGELGSVLVCRGLWTEAREILELMHRCPIRENLGPNYPYVLVAVANLALVSLARGENEKAEQQLKEVIHNGEETYGNNHVFTFTARVYLAMTLHNQGKWNEAKGLVDILLSETHGHVTEKRLKLVIASGAASSIYGTNIHIIEEYVPLLERSLEDIGALHEQHHPSARSAANNLAIAYFRMGRTDDAKCVLLRALSKATGPGLPEEPVPLALMHNFAWISLYSAHTVPAGEETRKSDMSMAETFWAEMIKISESMSCSSFGKRAFPRSQN